MTIGRRAMRAMICAAAIMGAATFACGGLEPPAGNGDPVDEDGIIVAPGLEGTAASYDSPKKTIPTKVELEAAPQTSPKMVDMKKALYGDLNGDGLVNVVDVQCLILTLRWPQEPDKALGGPDCLTSYTSADLNCDGLVTDLDYPFIVDLSLGKALPLEVDSDANSIHDSCDNAA